MIESIPEPLLATLRTAYDPSEGHWRSRLSASALAAATAGTAFRVSLAAPEGPPPELAAELATGWRTACAWLIAHQNPDGGWGDTPDSPSNLSTTVLAWSTLESVRTTPLAAPAATTEAATRWLVTACGGALTPDHLAARITAVYGTDRTFAAPILLLCALNGVLGPADDAWRRVPQLPCEFAALPHSLFRHLRLGVVSYALPALIAVGLCRHRHLGGPALTGRLRTALTPRLLRRLERLQPPHGGFLEATPLSAFVAMSLASSGWARHPVTVRALRFLLDSFRADRGDWPIDTNLDTWVTVLAVQALGSRERIAATLADRNAPDTILRHLLDAQHHAVHPYTQARPGGWGWTALPGAVPDADDTSGALVALSRLCPPDHALAPEATRAAANAVLWLDQLQNTDGGIPTFCRGWGRLPFDRSAPDITAHAVEALDAWLPRLPTASADRARRVLCRALNYLLRHQVADGTWLPLWFGTQTIASGDNPIFGTARVLHALEPHVGEPDVDPAVERARAFLRAHQNPDGSWGQSLDRATTGTAEETGMVLRALPADDPARPAAAAWIAGWLASGGTPSPIGLYFARLWYAEALYPALWLTAGLSKGLPTAH